MKTWIDLLGSEVRNERVEGRCIVRVSGKHRQVLHTCDSPEQAQEVFAAWLKEVYAKQQAEDERQEEIDRLNDAEERKLTD